MSKQNKTEISYLNTQGVTKIIQSNGNNGYTIIPIDSYEQAHKYSEYASWCTTRDQYEFDRYTKGGKRLYFCLKDGFENVTKNDEGAPLNTYGLSMISVKVETNGDLLDIITRYNYSFNGENNEGLCTVAQLEDVLDVKFYKVFLPYTGEELHENGVILFDEVQELLDNGKNPEDIFDYCENFSNGYARVVLNNKYNLIDKENKLLFPNQWFDYCLGFIEGYANVSLNDKSNWIDTNGKYLSEQWFDYCSNFQEGYAIVKLNGKYNFIDKNMKYLSEQWFDDVYTFNNGYSNVKLNGKWNIIDKNGNYISKQWSKWRNVFNKDMQTFV